MQALSTESQTRILNHLRNRRTTYELVLTNGEQSYCIAYASSRSRSTLLQVCRKYGNRIVAVTGSESVTFGQHSSDGATMGSWTIRFTGRTHREVIACNNRLQCLPEVN